MWEKKAQAGQRMNGLSSRRRGPSLTVYKASAGSGKTFTIVTEYIKLLIREPGSYRTILAVTFTNKATRELKERILVQLYGLWKGLEESTAYEERICADMDVEPSTVRERAGMALHGLLHDYSNFRVETIDTFFQSVLRNMARELGLGANLRVEVGDREVEREAVDRLIGRLKGKDREMRWITEYIRETMSEGESWNVIGEIKRFGENIFKDVYQAEGKRIMEAAEAEEMFEGLIGELRKECNESKAIMAEKGRRFVETIYRRGLSIEDFSHGKRGVAGFFEKLRKGDLYGAKVNTYVSAARDDCESWVAKRWRGVQRDSINLTSQLLGTGVAGLTRAGCIMERWMVVELVEEELRPILIEALDDLPTQLRRLRSAELTLRHINQLRMLGSIEKEVRAIDNEVCRFLLCHTQHALGELINGSDAPFIYERTGCRLKHIMIDEFQDTSRTQWKNFKVLLDESMSHRENTNLIVGDVKQSIYRWRNGDWGLLADIRGEWKNAGEMVKVNNLDTNYRSRGNIVKFNNAFFKAAAEREYEQLRETDEARAEKVKRAYADVCQKALEGKRDGGRVEISVLPEEKGEQQSSNRVRRDVMLELVAAKVEELLTAGTRESDIAILTRKNGDVEEIASYLAWRLPKVKLVSDEAFRLDASEAVNIIMDAMKLMVDPEDSITRASLTSRYRKRITKDMKDSYLLPDAEGAPAELLPEEFSKRIYSLRSLPLIELTERLYNIFSLSRLEGEGAYVCTFHDCMGEYLRDTPDDLRQFVEYWGREMKAKMVSCDYPEGVRLMTIHKSKGLEFESVIVPYCDWRLYHNDLIWCKSEEEPYNRLPIIPINYKKEVKDSVFGDYYKEETMQLAVDNLNLLYVAFTRASANLFVMSRRKSSLYRQELISDCLPQVGEAIGAETENIGARDGIERLTFGTLYISGTKTERKETANVFLQPSSGIDIAVESHEGNVNFRQSNDSRNFVEGDDDERQSGYIKRGSLLHNVLSRISTVDDIERIVREMGEEGLTGEGETSPKSLLEMLRERVESEKARDWFAPRWRLFNECTILSIDATTGEVVKKRPDRAMYDPETNEMIIVDFKFGKHRDEYHKQVGEYMTLVRNMGYENVKGYLWFVYTNEIEEVKA